MTTLTLNDDQLVLVCQGLARIMSEEAEAAGRYIFDYADRPDGPGSLIDKERNRYLAAAAILDAIHGTDYPERHIFRLSQFKTDARNAARRHADRRLERGDHLSPAQRALAAELDGIP
ncbi:hypothetical protein [Enterovirga aerilata]|uniref:Uncharacterized protein n=1 Tax=Enterovirga aerilata TaxID=2730920 RepID=A0A849IGL3_9HYPH|nr:hypothetical protein [Enterovirga sp. DB1703]NNM75087.1 hypothetical protein [Enterovirga sp. DB1703]